MRAELGLKDQTTFKLNVQIYQVLIKSNHSAQVSSVNIMFIYQSLSVWVYFTMTVRVR